MSAPSAPQTLSPPSSSNPIPTQLLQASLDQTDDDNKENQETKEEKEQEPLYLFSCGHLAPPGLTIPPDLLRRALLDPLDPRYTHLLGRCQPCDYIAFRTEVRRLREHQAQQIRYYQGRIAEIKSQQRRQHQLQLQQEQQQQGRYRRRRFRLSAEARRMIDENARMVDQLEEGLVVELGAALRSYMTRWPDLERLHRVAFEE